MLEYLYIGSVVSVLHGFSTHCWPHSVTLFRNKFLPFLRYITCMVPKAVLLSTSHTLHECYSTSHDVLLYLINIGDMYGTIHNVFSTEHV